MPTQFAAMLLAVAAVLAGCGSSGEAPAPAVVTISYGSFGTSADIDCGAGKALDVGGSNNTLNVSGECASLTIGGSDNTITAQRVDGELSVAGVNNTVNYRDGEPAVTDAGSGNRISRR